MHMNKPNFAFRLSALLLCLVLLCSGCATQADVDAAAQDGYDAGYEEAYQIGLADGTDAGYASGYAEGYEVGKRDWYGTGYDAGYDDGYDDGCQVQLYGEPAAAQGISPASQPQTVSATVYVTDTGSKYHRSGCQYLRQSSNAISLDDAKAF